MEKVLELCTLKNVLIGMYLFTDIFLTIFLIKSCKRWWNKGIHYFLISFDKRASPWFCSRRTTENNSLVLISFKQRASLMFCSRRTTKNHSLILAEIIPAFLNVTSNVMQEPRRRLPSAFFNPIQSNLINNTLQ